MADHVNLESFKHALLHGERGDTALLMHEIVQLYLKNKHETPENKALLMHAFGMAAGRSSQQRQKTADLRRAHCDVGSA